MTVLDLKEALPDGVDLWMVRDALKGMSGSNGLTKFQQINAGIAQKIVDAIIEHEDIRIITKATSSAPVKGSKVRLSHKGKQEYESSPMNPYREKGVVVDYAPGWNWVYTVLWDNECENTYRDGEIELA